MEMWRDIRGYEGLYQVSNYGRVRSLDKNEISICCRGGRHRNKKWIARKTHKGFKWSYNMFN